MPTRRQHWEQVYETTAADEVSWYQATPETSLRLIEAAGMGRTARVLDVGGGASALVDHLLDRGYTRVGVLDLSSQALSLTRDRLGPRGKTVEWFDDDVMDFAPAHPWDVWHDRAVFHFLTDPEERAKYRAALIRSLALDGQAIVATFGPDGPQRCSGHPTQRYSADELAAELGDSLRLLHSELELHRTPGGNVQQFLFCRFERVA